MAQPQQQQQAQPAQPAAPAVETGKLRGEPPQIFTGIRSKSDDFLNEFELYRGLNANHELIMTPYFRVLLALNYIAGRDVKHWKEDQRKQLEEKVTRQNNPIGRDQGVLWTEFVEAFNRTFTDTTKVQSAFHQLHQCTMKGDDLDAYIARFQHLAHEAGFDMRASATVALFSKGLNRHLISDIMDKEATTPTTFDEWVTAARRQQQKSAHKRALLNPTSRWTQWQARPPPAQHHNGHRRGYVHPNDRTVPMDVDQDYHTRINKAFTEADKRKYREEGRCFECNRQGHMARECPNKKRQPFKSRQNYPNRQSHFQQQRSKTQHDRKPQYNFQRTKRFPPRQSHARTAFIEEMDDSDKENVPPMNNDASDIPTIAARTARFSEEEREQWVKEMRETHGLDFS
jgi:hypothetical protein